jgi:3-oxoadipate enol-lactonase
MWRRATLQQRQPRTTSIQAGGLRFSVIEEGSGGRPLFVEHGFCGAKEDFAEVAVRLGGEGWHVVAPDLRGHGSSDHPEGAGSYGLEIFTGDLLAIADYLSWGTFCLLGHSMGGMIAQLVAIDHGERLEGLLLLDTGHGPVKGIDPAMLEAGKELVRASGMEALVEALRRGGPLSTPAHERLVRERPGFEEFTDAKALACSTDMWLAVADEMHTQADRLERLRAVDAPTLVVAGEQDTPFVEDSRRMAQAIPGARLEILPEAGHSPQFENPDAFWSVVMPFLEGLPARGPARSG